jgi:hypothetical protein
MPNITVVNRKQRVPGAIYCGRGSPLGNPYRMNSEAQRDQVCEQYETYFKENVKVPGPLRDEVIRIYRLAQNQDIALECFCAPKRCHCDTIKAFIEENLP